MYAQKQNAPSGIVILYLIVDAAACRVYLVQRYCIRDLEEWVRLHTSPSGVKRSEQVAVVGDSKMMKMRIFMGFLCNVTEPVEVVLGDERIELQPHNGMAFFVEDFEHFDIPDDVVVVGVENSENFQHLLGQKYLFAGQRTLFVSRYPQSNDLRSNRYVHFGDFDLAGIHIFLSEFYAYLGERPSFFGPQDIEQRLRTGNRALYEKQYSKFKNMSLPDKRLCPMVDMMHRYGRGYEQEGYIKE